MLWIPLDLNEPPIVNRSDDTASRHANRTVSVDPLFGHVAPGCALKAKYYASVKDESIDAELPLWVNLGSPADVF